MIHFIDRFDNIDLKGGNLSSDGGNVLMSAFIANHHNLDDFLDLHFLMQEELLSIQTQIF